MSSLIKTPWRMWLFIRRIVRTRDKLTYPNLIWFIVLAIILHPVIHALGFLQMEGRVRVRGYSKKFHMRIGTTDPLCFLEVILEEEYKEVTKLCDPRVHGGVILDLGSNVGYSIRYFMERFPEAVLIAVEPDPENFQTLIANVGECPDPDRVQVLRNAVSGRRETVDLDTSAGSWATKTIQVPAIAVPAETVEALTIPELLGCAGHACQEIALLKCDIEGSEEALLKESPDWLFKTGVCVIESHAPYWASRVREDVERYCPGRFEFKLEDELVWCRALLPR